MVQKWLESVNVVSVDPDIPPQASPERVFIYLLLLNSKDLHSSQPFHVGYTNNLKKRLTNHAAINWHKKRFGYSPKLWIAGTVHLNFAEKAVVDLEQQLLEAHVLLLKQKPLHKVDRLEKQSIPDLRRYTLNSKPLTSIIKGWDLKWGLKHKQIVELSKNSNTVVINVNKPPIVIPQGLLVNVIRTRTYKTSKAVKLAQSLAKGFDEKNQTSSFVIPKTESAKKQTRLLTEATESLQAIAADWTVVDGELTPGEKVTLKPTTALTEHIRKQL